MQKKQSPLPPELTDAHPLDRLTWAEENGLRKSSKPDTRSRGEVPEHIKRQRPEDRLAWARQTNHA